MNKRKIIFYLVVVFLTTFSLEAAIADGDGRQKVEDALRKAGLGKKLDAGVVVSADENGVVCIADEGSYLMQYMVVEPNVSADTNLVIDPNIKIPPSANKAVIVTHGYLDKSKKDWPAELATEIRKKTDPNEWLCGIFDWRGGAVVITPADATKYSREIAGPRLAKALLTLKPNIEHVHLIAHSAGCWTINSAAKIIAQQTNAQIHLTFLDAYTPTFLNKIELGKIESENTIWAEHYYTKDLTLKYTEADLSFAHNVDLTKIDLLIKEHEFPYRWYYATVAGKYRDKDWESKDKVLTRGNSLDYGFTRSREAGEKNWEKSLTLKKGQKAVVIKKPKKKPFNLNFLKKKNIKKNKDKKNE